MQLGVLVYPRTLEERTALISVANEMRRNDEPLEARQKGRILSSFSPTVNTYEELTTTLSAAPPGEMLATYEWLAEGKADARQHEFVRASLLKLEGKREEAREAFEQMRGELKRRGYNGRIVDHVERAMRELSAR
jgi:hypothetical protein